jgi:plasmid maintenance system antidote protein VapI
MEAQRRAHRATAADLRQGIRSSVSAAEATAYALDLVHAGMSPMDIAERSGVSVTRVKDIIQGKCDQIYRVTEAAILGIEIPEDGWTPITDGLANSVGTQRRLRALSVQGFPLSLMANELATTVRTVSEVRAGSRPRVRISFMRAVTKLHDRLWDEDPLSFGIPGSSVTRAKQWAQAQGWYPTEAWADINDPDCEPVLKTPRYVVLTEDARELMEGQGYTIEQAADRLGVKRSAITNARTYYNRVKAKAAS